MGLDRDAIRERVESDPRRDASVVPIWRQQEQAEGDDTGFDFDRIPEASPQEAARLCQIDLSDLKTTLSNHAPIYAYVASRYYHARRERARAEREVDRVRAATFNKIQREEPDLAANKTERRVEDHPDVNAAEDALYEAKELEDRLRGILEGLKERGTMLNQVAAIQRREQENYG